MQPERTIREDAGESSLHQQMMQGFLEWVAGLRTLKQPTGGPGAIDDEATGGNQPVAPADSPVDEESADVVSPERDAVSPGSTLNMRRW